MVNRQSSVVGSQIRIQRTGEGHSATVTASICVHCDVTTQYRGACHVEGAAGRRAVRGRYNISVQGRSSGVVQRHCATRFYRLQTRRAIRSINRQSVQRLRSTDGSTECRSCIPFINR